MLDPSRTNQFLTSGNVNRDAGSGGQTADLQSCSTPEASGLLLQKGPVLPGLIMVSSIGFPSLTMIP